MQVVCMQYVLYSTGRMCTVHAVVYMVVYTVMYVVYILVIHTVYIVYYISYYISYIYQHMVISILLVVTMHRYITVLNGSIFL